MIKVEFVELESLGDLGRLVSTTRIDESIPQLYCFEYEGERYVGFLYFSPSFTEDGSLPIFFYIKSSEVAGKKFLYYKVEEKGESVGFSEGKVMGALIYPIIFFKKPPNWLRPT